MLQKIRDNTQGLVAKIFMGFVILVFGLWGVEYLVGSFISTGTSVTVNGVEISEFQVESEAQRRTQQMLASLGPDADFSAIDPSLFREAAINDLVRQELLVQAALKSGMAVSGATIDRQIASIPEFQVNGVFNNDLARAVLNSGGYTPASFRAALARDTLLGHLSGAYTASGFATQADVERLAALTEQKRDFRYLLVNFQNQAGGIQLSDADVESYYQNNQQEFMREEQVAVEYIELSKNAILPEIEIGDAEIETRYEEEVAAFQSQVERRASHILLEASTQDEVQAAVAQATEIKARIDMGESFEALAMEFSDDTGSAETGGDVGFTTGTSFVEPFEEALRQLAVGEVSEPVVTEFGVHLIKLTEQSSSEFETLEQARDRIAMELRSEAAERIYAERARQLGDLAFESLDLQEPASALGLEIQTTEPFGRSGGAGIAANQGVIDAAFSLEVLEDGLNSDVIPLDAERSVVLRVAEHTPAQVRELSEVRGEIEVLLRDQRVSEMARETGERIANSLRGGGNVDSLLESQGLSWVQAEEVGRDNGDLDPELLDHVFSMAKPEDGQTTVQGFTLESGEYAVVELQEVTPGALEDLEDNERTSIAGFVAQQSGNAAFEAFLVTQEAEADIER